MTSGGYGYRVGGSIAYAYLPVGDRPDGGVEVGVIGAWVAAEIVDEPVYDPRNERVRRLPEAGAGA